MDIYRNAYTYELWNRGCVNPQVFIVRMKFSAAGLKSGVKTNERFKPALSLKNNFPLLRETGTPRQNEPIHFEYEVPLELNNLCFSNTYRSHTYQGDQKYADCDSAFHIFNTGRSLVR